MPLRPFVTALVLAAVFALSACDSSEERAERFYQSGLEYLEQGDPSRALIEFRNALKLNTRHKEARLTYARVERERGNQREAYAQYLRLVEQFPEDLESLTVLAEMATQAGQWDDAARHVAAAQAVSPDDPAIKAIAVAVDYGRAAESNDVDGLIASARSARELLAAMPENLLLLRVIIDDQIRSQDFDDALATIGTAIVLAPADRTLYAQRLSIYAARGDNVQVEAGLIEMVKVFATAPEMGTALVRWYVSLKELDKADAFLRSQMAAKPDDQIAMLDLIRFLAENRGQAAAIAELDTLIAAGNDSAVLRSARAGFRFDQGQRDAAITEMQEILETAEASDDTRRIKVGLARMLTTTGNAVAARQLVEEVLAEDAGDAEALKLKATWLIMADEVGEAISLLRGALDDNPRDASVMTLMAQAYERDGNRDLLRDMLSLAVEASGRAPDESLRFAQFLVAEGRLLSAEGILIDSLRISPGEARLLAPLGELYVHMKDWNRAESVADELERTDTEQSLAVARTLRTAILSGQQNTSDAIGYLQSIVDQGGGDLQTRLAIIRAHLGNGDNDKALAYAASLVADAPDDPDLRFIEASVQSLAGQTTVAEATFRDLITADGSRDAVWMALFSLVIADEARVDEAEKLLDDALAQIPASGEIRWAKAGLLERRGDVEGAIAIYEGLYTENSANPIIANNLASLLSNYRTDPESLDRASVIARRLRGSNVPAYQDTFGWIAYQNREYEVAAGELEKAAAGLPKDPTVRYHLAKTYLALGRKDEALAAFQLVVETAPTDDQSAFVIDARAEVAKLGENGSSAGN